MHGWLLFVEATTRADRHRRRYHLPHGQQLAASFLHYYCRCRTKRVGIILLCVWCSRLGASKSTVRYAWVLALSPLACGLLLGTWYVPVFVLFEQPARARWKKKTEQDTTHTFCQIIFRSKFTWKPYIIQCLLKLKNSRK